MQLWIIYSLLSAIFAGLVAIFGKIGLKDVDSTLAVVRAQKEITGNRSRDKQIIRHFGIPNSFAFSPRMKFPGLETLSESEKQAFIKGYKRRLKAFTV